MKKSIVLGFILLISWSALEARNADLFQLDEKIIVNSFTDLNKLDSYLEDKEHLSLSSMIRLNDPNLKNMSLSDEMLNAYNGNSDNEDLMGIPAFWWGFGSGCVGVTFGYTCWLGPLGVLVVYLITDDKEETKKATWGCLAGSALGCVGYYVFWVLILSLENSYYYY